jgi:outer membrane protein assembly factor BamE (lipoprotein component of BamABCDE complex)
MFLGAMMMLSACGAKTLHEEGGLLQDSQSLSSIHLGDSQKVVREKLGSPFATSFTDKNTWYYGYLKVSRYLLGQNTEEQCFVALDFKNMNLEKIRIYDTAKAKKISPIKTHTPSILSDSILRSLNNIGAVY